MLAGSECGVDCWPTGWRAGDGLVAVWRRWQHFPSISQQIQRHRPTDTGLISVIFLISIFFLCMRMMNTQEWGGENVYFAADWGGDGGFFVVGWGGDGVFSVNWWWQHFVGQQIRLVVGGGALSSHEPPMTWWRAGASDWQWRRVVNDGQQTGGVLLAHGQRRMAEC